MKGKVNKDSKMFLKNAKWRDTYKHTSYTRFITNGKMRETIAITIFTGKIRYRTNRCIPTLNKFDASVAELFNMPKQFVVQTK